MATSPLKLQNGDQLAGTGDRIVKIGWVGIEVYHLGVYLDSAGAQSSLCENFGGESIDNLLSDEDFFPALISGNFRKTFRFLFRRKLAKSKLTSGFEKSLLLRCNKNHTAEAQSVLNALVPDEGVIDGDVLCVQCSENTQTLLATFASAAGGSPKELLRVESGGEGGVWRAFQMIFWDSHTELPTIKHGSIVNIPEILAAAAPAAAAAAVKPGIIKRLTEEEQADVAEQVTGRGGFSKRRGITWAEFAGRASAAESDAGYKFGDITRGIGKNLATLGRKAISTANRSRLSVSSRECSIDAQQAAASAQQEYVRRLEKNNQILESTVKSLQTELEGMTESAYYRASEAEKQKRKVLPALLVGIAAGESLLGGSGSVLRRLLPGSTTATLFVLVLFFTCMLPWLLFSPQEILAFAEKSKKRMKKE